MASCACTPGALPPLEGVTTLAQAGVAVTPAMQQWAASMAYDCSQPMGRVAKRWFGTTPIVARVECHPERWNADGTRTPGAFHAVTLYFPTSPSMLPPVETVPQIVHEEQRQAIRRDERFLIAAALVAGATYAWWRLQR